jgi:uncharacterized protein YjbI with pentapeptide repeats
MEGQELVSRYKEGERYFARAGLSGAKLKGAYLIGAILRGANLEGVNLAGARVTDEQLARAVSLKDAALPDGTRHD